MKITAIIENHVSKRDLVGEHGLSFMIESNGKKILFDTGQGKMFARNARKMGIDISLIDKLIISHGHDDHTGGLPLFIENNNIADILLKREALLPKFKYDKYIGISRHINTKTDRFQFVDKVFEVADNVFVVPHISTFYKNDTHFEGFYTEKDNRRIPDSFADELFLVLIGKDGLTILSSCSHNGITNMVKTATVLFSIPVVQVIGGFHLKDSGSESADHIAEYFDSTGVRQVFTCHCTGLDMYYRIQQKSNAQVAYFDTGAVLDI